MGGLLVLDTEASDTSVYVRAYYDEQQPITPEIEGDVFLLLSQPAWRYWRVDLLDGCAREVPELPWTSTDGYFYSIPEESGMFLGIIEADFSRTTLHEPTASGFARSFEVTGTINVLSLLNRRF